MREIINLAVLALKPGFYPEVETGTKSLFSQDSTGDISVPLVTGTLVVVIAVFGPWPRQSAEHSERTEDGPMEKGKVTSLSLQDKRSQRLLDRLDTRQTLA